MKKMRFVKTMSALFVLGVFVSFGQADPVPLAQFNFNTDDGTPSADSVGSVGGITGTFSGVSGYYAAYPPSNSDGSQSMRSPSGGTSRDGFYFSNVTGGLSSMTVCGWIKRSGTEARLLSSGHTNGFDLYMSAGTIALIVNGVHADAFSSQTISMEWSFFAATYDSSTSSVNYYISDSDTTLVTSSAGLSGGDVGVGSTNIWIGNSPIIDRRFSGLMDNVGIYGAALTKTELESVMVMNDIPEPATMSLLAAGGIVAVIRRRKK